ncbi:MAG TPA: hypothetical protein DHV14_04020 [Micrococcales bacterium]|uniref:PH domain-containing protein n=1 Tax=Miniimonas arenae TaxID=676201 RepID=A0A5C5BBT4_9MICO|nr:PH domain-containing protein [Miniimonas arenae]TNU74703.1 PH domain-containing protein [Miniimonas arenae]HCX84304.1 hypothetical protein [Micrococcales bacterium]
MGYPQDVLAPDENVVVHEHPHWKALLLPALAAVLVTVVGVGSWWAVLRADPGEPWPTVTGVAVGVIWTSLFVWLFVAPLVRWGSTHFVITDRRVMYRTGVLTRSGIDIPLSRINSVQFRHGFVDRMLRTGTLVIESASDDPLEFDDIPRVERVHALLYHEVYDTLGEEEAGR